MQYRIRVRGHLDPAWQDRFAGWHIEHQGAGATLLSGQAALQGMLLQIIRLGLTLLSLETNEATGGEATAVHP